MLKFDSEHKNIKGSLKNSKDKIKLRNIVLGALIVSSVFLFSGCAKNVDCNIDVSHAHRYVSENHLDKYLVSEKEHVGSWIRSDDYILVNKEQEKLLDFINDKDLYIIEDNQDEIKSIISSNEDYIEYRYSYTYMMPIPHHRKIGKISTVTYTHVPQIRHSWTSDPNHPRLTGEQRIVHHMYQGYKIVTNEKGKYKIIASEFVDNPEDLSSEYKYISSDFCKKVYLNNKDLEVDYEDGPEEKNEQTKETEQNSNAEIEYSNSKVR